MSFCAAHIRLCSALDGKPTGKALAMSSKKIVEPLGFVQPIDGVRPKHDFARRFTHPEQKRCNSQMDSNRPLTVRKHYKTFLKNLGKEPKFIRILCCEQQIRFAFFKEKAMHEKFTLFLRHQHIAGSVKQR